MDLAATVLRMVQAAKQDLARQTRQAARRTHARAGPYDRAPPGRGTRGTRCNAAV